MTILSIPLSKLLKLLYLPTKMQTSALKKDIRIEKNKQIEKDKKIAKKKDGGDFYGPFWADAKGYLHGKIDLAESTDRRISKSLGKARLYPLLRDGFLRWWDERRRWQNEEFEFLNELVKARIQIKELGATVKIENTVALSLSGGSERIIYPYFAERPTLDSEATRLGLWAMNQAFPQHELADMRILDVFRGTSFGTVDFALSGSERDIFISKYDKVIARWNELWEED